ncbi:MAG: bifunctional pyr operon transcriptional regulator/uracil phosphoribosyltransferase PyrR [Solirubrobacteraceae bacterium]|nr:bifunctional pyr operon transcriptional regulator/uracil phosphoribosyltransferase PyrR [Solirubrobacteraceae bacterium]
MSQKIVLDGDAVSRALTRIAHEIAERDARHGPIVIVGIHRRGVPLSRRLAPQVSELVEAPVELGTIDIAFYRDDLGTRPSAPIVNSTEIDVDLTGKTVVLVDDVLFTGRTTRAAIDALFDLGRPGRVRLAVLIDRGHRELPLRPDFVGKNLPTSSDERVHVRVTELDGTDEVTLDTPDGAGA